MKSMISEQALSAGKGAVPEGGYFIGAGGLSPVAARFVRWHTLAADVMRGYLWGYTAAYGYTGLEFMRHEGKYV